MNVERGDAQIAMGLSGDQVAALDKTVNVASTPSATVVFLFLNQNPEINEWTAKPECVAAVKKALDYDSLLELAGLGASQATGVIPSGFLGALPKEEALKFDLAAGTKGAEDCGMAGQTIKLGFPNDIDPAGTSLTTVAQRVQQQLATAGIVVELAPAPFATEIDAYRDGKAHMGLWYWNPDYMDPANYLAFGPGQKVGLRAGWTAEMNAPIGEKVAAGYTTGDLDARKTLFEEWGRAMNAESPFIPLIQPGSNVAHQASVTNVYYNPTWLINVAGLGAA
jgi:peptide/nickel transport system substrate-binding protein